MARRRTALALAASTALAAGCGSLDYPSVGPVPTTPTDIPLTPPPPAPSLTPVMMQAFYWDVPQVTPAGSWWNHLQAKAPELAAAGITAVWIPPPYKGHVGADDVGDGVYDRYDLGEFDQKGSVATRYGTLPELAAAVAALHAAGVRVYADIVMNHMMGGDGVEQVSLLGGGAASVHTRFDFPGRGQTYSSFAWTAERFNGSDEGGWKHGGEDRRDGEGDVPGAGEELFALGAEGHVSLPFVS